MGFFWSYFLDFFGVAAEDRTETGPGGKPGPEPTAAPAEGPARSQAAESAPAG